MSHSVMTGTSGYVRVGSSLLNLACDHSVEQTRNPYLALTAECISPRVSGCKYMTTEVHGSLVNRIEACCGQ